MTDILLWMFMYLLACLAFASAFFVLFRHPPLGSWLYADRTRRRMREYRYCFGRICVGLV